MQILGNRALVEFIESDERTRSGLIWIPREARDPSYTGIVIEIGPEQMNVKVGERVVFSRYAGVPLRGLNGKTRAVLDDGEILAVFREEEAATKRITYAFDMTAIVSEKGDEWIDGQETIYAHYNHQSDTLYVTIEVPLEAKLGKTVHCPNCNRVCTYGELIHHECNEVVPNG